MKQANSFLSAVGFIANRAGVFAGKFVKVEEKIGQQFGDPGQLIKKTRDFFKQMVDSAKTAATDSTAGGPASTTAGWHAKSSAEKTSAKEQVKEYAKTQNSASSGAAAGEAVKDTAPTPAVKVDDAAAKKVAEQPKVEIKADSSADQTKKDESKTVAAAAERKAPVENVKSTMPAAPVAPIDPSNSLIKPTSSVAKPASAIDTMDSFGRKDSESDDKNSSGPTLKRVLREKTREQLMTMAESMNITSIKSHTNKAELIDKIISATNRKQ